MSEEIYESEGLYVTRFVASSADGPDRVRWQFTTPAHSAGVVLDREAVLTLSAALCMDAIPSPSELP